LARYSERALQLLSAQDLALSSRHTVQLPTLQAMRLWHLLPYTCRVAWHKDDLTTAALDHALMYTAWLSLKMLWLLVVLHTGVRVLPVYVVLLWDGAAAIKCWLLLLLLIMLMLIYGPAICICNTRDSI
jgi:hypothetical protein